MDILKTLGLKLNSSPKKSSKNQAARAFARAKPAEEKSEKGLFAKLADTMTFSKEARESMDKDRGDEMIDFWKSGDVGDSRLEEFKN